MLSFHSDPSIKSNYLARVAGHADADEIVKGRYWENGKGCAVGCTIHGETHESFERELGIPQMLAWLEDVIFCLLGGICGRFDEVCAYTCGRFWWESPAISCFKLPR
jgi:hypothetical protein